MASYRRAHTMQKKKKRVRFAPHHGHHKTRKIYNMVGCNGSKMKGGMEEGAKYGGGCASCVAVPSSMIGGYTYSNRASSNRASSNRASSSRATGSSGSKRRKRSKANVNIRGGGLVPQDLLNLGRGIMNNIGGIYNAANGYPEPVNPLPYKHQYFRNPTRL